MGILHVGIIDPTLACTLVYHDRNEVAQLVHSSLIGRKTRYAVVIQSCDNEDFKSAPGRGRGWALH